MILAAIPARWGASRFPGKPLADLGGRPVVAWVVDAARATPGIDRVVVVTDHAGIGRAAEAAGARAVVIDRPAASGSDRIAQLLKADPESEAAEVIVNVQGDEPFIEPAVLAAALAALEGGADVGTVARPLAPDEDPADPHRVKVARAADGRALWFSRAPIPDGGPHLIHLGIYAYRRAAFDRFADAAPTALERAERLEQLRALEIGLEIRCAVRESRSIGIDTPDDLARAAARLERAR